MIHEWREDSPEGFRYLRAQRMLGRWQFGARMKAEEDWTELPSLEEEELRTLRDILWRKYQRRRVPYEQVLEIDKLLGIE